MGVVQVYRIVDRLKRHSTSLLSKLEPIDHTSDVREKLMDYLNITEAKQLETKKRKIHKNSKSHNP
jgi:hypothetical protein